MDTLIQLTASGLALGAIYALVALGFVVIYRASQVFNFAQGEFLTFGAFAMVTALDMGLPWALGLVVAMGSEMDRRDRVMVMACDTRCRAMSDGMRQPSSATADAIHEFLEKEPPAGASDVAASLRDALRLAREAGAGQERSLQLVYVGDGLAGTLQRLLGSAHGHLAEDAPLIVGALGDARHHALRVEDAVLVDDEAALDARRFHDESSVGLGERLFATLGPRYVLLADVCVERFDEFFVRDLVGRNEEACGGNEYAAHDRTLPASRASCTPSA